MAEKEYTIHLNNIVRIPQTRFANKVIYAVKKFAQKHTHSEFDAIRLSNDVNEAIWERGKNYKINRLNVVLRKKDKEMWVFAPNGKDLKEFEKKTIEQAKATKKETKTRPKKEESKTMDEKTGETKKTNNQEITKKETKQQKKAEEKTPKPTTKNT